MQSKKPLYLKAAFCFCQKTLFHSVFVGLDHFLDHLAADGAGFARGQVAVVAFLQVHANLP